MSTATETIIVQALANANVHVEAPDTIARQIIDALEARGYALRKKPAPRKKPASKHYALDERELNAMIDKLRKDGVAEGKWSVGRFKGLGEMNAEQLWETTLNPDTRRLLPVQLGAMDFLQTAELMTQLMGKGEASARRELMELHGDSVEVDV